MKETFEQSSANLQAQLEYNSLLSKEVRKIRKNILIEKIKIIFKFQKAYYGKRIAIGASIVFLCMGLWNLSLHNSHMQRLLGLYANRPVATSDTIYIQDSTKTQEAFLEKLGYIESRGNYKATNQFGYMGKYQFGRAALTAIGLGGISNEDFLDNPELQDVAMKLLMKKNKYNLATLIGKYQGKTMKGIYITESGILAAAHLGGGGNAALFLESNGNNDFRDGNGTPVSRYFRELGGYKLKF